MLSVWTLVLPKEAKTDIDYNYIPVCLLLCGNVHPCPGPAAEHSNRSYNTNEYKMLDKRVCTLYISTPTVLLPILTKYV